ncbi:MAG: molybdenum cofactor biosynthesis protein MoaE [Nocardioides sp.]|nr:molybdenum cofactor biosynthesis protein MoaE [Nocardioides sp.]
MADPSPSDPSASDARPVIRLLALREEPLDVTEVLEAVSDPRAGAVDVFVGAVRDHDNAQGVTGLDYSAHPSAVDRLREVAEGIVAEHDVLALAGVHRTGSLAIGDLAVVCAVATAHRGEAFAATEAFIDRLKESVPIWKHQRFTDGTDEWVGTP